jgi:hypothetical protein
MAEDVDRLREEEPLRRLLARYAGAEDREAWQDRVMEVEGVPAPALARLHGNLIAYGWVELNLAAPPVMRSGVLPQCYRATAAGRRAVKEVKAGVSDDVEARAASCWQGSDPEAASDGRAARSQALGPRKRWSALRGGHQHGKRPGLFLVPRRATWKGPLSP